MIFHKETPLVYIKEALEEADNYCDDIRSYFIKYEEMNYGEAIEAFKNANPADTKTIGRILTNLVVLNSYNDTYCNDELILILLNAEIGHMKMLMVWRRMKNIDNLSNIVKDKMIKYLKGNLPNTEKQNEYEYRDNKC